MSGEKLSSCVKRLPSLAAGRFLVAAAVLLCAGCSARRFDRFIDHPILSWAPITQAEVDSVNPFSTPEHHMNLYPTRECFELAKERTDFLDQSDFDDRTLLTVFNGSYSDCVRAKDRWGR